MDIRMSNIASPMPQIRAKFTNKLGIPLSGCKVYTYEPNSNIPKKTWIDIDKTVENTNPILLDSAGEADIFLDGLYQIVVKDRFGFVVYNVEKTGTHTEWDASFVVDGNITQHERNTGVKSLNQLRLTTPSKKGDRVFLASVNEDQNKGSGDFIATQKASLIDNGGTIIASPNPLLFWVRTNYDVVAPEMFGAVGDGITDDTQAWNKLLDSITAQGNRNWIGDMATQGRLGSGEEIELGVNSGYRITDTLWIPAYTSITGRGGEGFQNQYVSNYCGFIADFTDPYKSVLASNCYDATGNRVAVDLLADGDTEFGASKYSMTHGIKLRGFSIKTKSGTRALVGIKLQGSPQSIVDDIYIAGCDYSVISNASWVSKINVKSEHIKCGLLAYSANNACVFDGYYNPIADAPVPLSMTQTFISKAGVFDDPEQAYAKSILDVDSVSFGAVFKGNGASSSSIITSEKNSIGIVSVNSPLKIGALYTEVSKISGIYTYKTELNLGGFTGYLDTSAFFLDASTRLNIDSFKKGGLNVGSQVWNVSNSDVLVRVPMNVRYNQNFKYHEDSNIVYVNSTSGSNYYSGVTPEYAVNTVKEALQRISSKKSMHESTQHQKYTIMILDSATYTIDGEIVVSGDIDIVTDKPASYPTIEINYAIILKGGNLSFQNMVININSNHGFLSDIFVNSIYFYRTACFVAGNNLIYMKDDSSSQLSARGLNWNVSGDAAAKLVKGVSGKHIVNILNPFLIGDISISPLNIPETWKGKILI